jgi:hypothetical protein
MRRQPSFLWFWLCVQLLHHEAFLVQVEAQLFVGVRGYFLAEWHFLTDVYFELASKHFLVGSVAVAWVQIFGQVLEVG